jgi:hypothetical protein
MFETYLIMLKMFQYRNVYNENTIDWSVIYVDLDLLAPKDEGEEVLCRYTMKITWKIDTIYVIMLDR